MRRRARMLAAIALLALPGCANYLQHRADDALEMLDLGVTWSEKPGLAAYGDLASIAPGGFGYVDGYFAGIGGGQVGTTEHYEGSMGLLVWGYEEVGWAEHDKHVPGTLDRQHVGLIGVLREPLNRRLAYAPASVGYLHLGYAGLAASLRHGEMADFLLGWFGIDIAGDDGTKLGQGLEEMNGDLFVERKDRRPERTWCPRCAQRVWAPELAVGPGGTSPIRSIRRTFGADERADVCCCPLAKERAVAAAPRPTGRRATAPTPVGAPARKTPPRETPPPRGGVDLPIGPVVGTLASSAAKTAPSVAPAAAEQTLAKNCRLYQFLTSGGPQLLSTSAVAAGKVAQGALTVGKIAWVVGVTTLKVVGGVVRFAGALIASRRRRDEPPPRTARRSSPPRP